MKKMTHYRSAGACPPRSSGRPQHGEGQALALREIETGRSLLPEGIGPISVVRERLLPNGSGSGDPDLQIMQHGEGQALALR